MMEKPKEQEGLLSYEDLGKRLTIGVTNPRRPCERRVKQIARKYRHILRPVTVGGCSVGFRPTAVERLIEHLENN